MNNTYYANNRLISNYNNFHHNNMNFQNNMLLNNNPNLMNKDMQNYMAKMRQEQEIKKLQKSSDMIDIYDKSIIYNSVIRPIKVNQPSVNEMLNRYNNIGVSRDKEQKMAWNKRTNQPYKVILGEENAKKFIGRKKIDRDELIVHRVTDADKIGLNEELDKLKNVYNNHNKELSDIYSASKELENKKKFEYTQKEKYRIKYNPKDFDGLKDDHSSYYKKHIERLEKDKKTIDDIIESLLDENIVDKADTEILRKNNDNNKINDNIDTKETKHRIRVGKKNIKKQITTNTSSETNINNNKTNNKTNNNINAVDKINNLKMKYLKIQKK